MYHVDSPTQRIDVFDYDVATGGVENARTWTTIDTADGLPDGLTIDSEGCVWLALFQGGAVRRFDPDGRLMLDVALPTPFVTCPAFGGDDLSVLFVTSSQHKIPPRGARRPPPGWRALHDRDRRQGSPRQPGRARRRRQGDRVSGRFHGRRGLRDRWRSRHRPCDGRTSRT